MEEHHDVIQFERVVQFEGDEAHKARYAQRERALYLVQREMREQGFIPATPSHPHATRIAPGRWLVEGRWAPVNGSGALRAFLGASGDDG